MHTFNIDATINQRGELHLHHLPFEEGEKVKVFFVAPNKNDEETLRRFEYEEFMKGYAEEDSIYDNI